MSTTSYKIFKPFGKNLKLLRNLNEKWSKFILPLFGNSVSILNAITSENGYTISKQREYQII